MSKLIHVELDEPDVGTSYYSFVKSPNGSLLYEGYAYQMLFMEFDGRPFTLFVPLILN